MQIQSIAVWIIVALAAVYLVRKYYRALSGKDKCCDDCGSSPCDSCSPSNGNPPCGFPKPAEKSDKE